jgi:hypothetical protein
VAATGYVRRAVGAVEKQPIAYWVRPDGNVEWYAGADKAAPFRSELSRIEAAWLRAATDEARENAAREAEALALRAIEALPSVGCVRDAGLVDIQTPGSIKAEMDTTANIIRQLDADIRASHVDASFKAAWGAFVDEWERFYKEHAGWFDRLWYASYEKTVEYRRRALEWREKFVAIGGTPTTPADIPPKTATERFGEAFNKIVNVALLGGGLFAAYKVITALSAKGEAASRNAQRSVRRSLNAELARVAQANDAGTHGSRNARSRRAHAYALQLSKGEIEALQFLRWRYASARAFVDGLVPLDESADRALSGEFDRNAGPYRFHIRAADVRKALRAAKRDGGDYGAIPNLRSEAVAWALAEEAARTP